MSDHYNQWRSSLLQTSPHIVVESLSSFGCYSRHAIVRTGPSRTVGVVVSSNTSSEEDPTESSYHGTSSDKDSH